MRRTSSRGFTLLEVMIALAILGGALTVLLRMSAQDVRASYRAKLLTIATNLARSKMNDLEEELIKNGFADSPEEEQGDFTDDGQPKFKWHAGIEKVVLPTSDQLASQAGKDASSGKLPPAPSPTDDKNNEALLNLAGGSSTGALGAGMVQMYLPLIGPILENAIRKVTLTVSWKIGGEEDSIRVICFFTDSKAIDLAMPGAAAAAATAGATSGTGTGANTTGTGSSTTSGPGTTRR